MKTYLFSTTTIINDDKYWIDNNYVREITIKENSIDEAINKYVSIVKDSYYVEITKNALKK